MSANWTKTKLDWLVSVARDRRARGLPLRVAVMLACAYMNKRTESAWPSLRRLAADLGTYAPNIHDACGRLVELGYLLKRGGGRGQSNRYWLPEVIAPGLTGDSAGTNTGDSARTNVTRDGTRVRTPQRRRGKKTRHARGEPGHAPRRVRAAPFPSDWTCGSRELTAAAQSAARWDRERAQKEFIKFRRWHEDRGTRSPDWDKNWTAWCNKGAEIQNRDRARSDDKVVAAARGWGPCGALQSSS
ncbi:MAG TPA: hypothetical protein VM487_03140 [Phycisphaerae bacterium]|nr:hypothetical protein [Phycisphaerae bacterium]